MKVLIENTVFCIAILNYYKNKHHLHTETIIYVRLVCYNVHHICYLLYFSNNNLYFNFDLNPKLNDFFGPLQEHPPDISKTIFSKNPKLFFKSRLQMPDILNHFTKLAVTNKYSASIQSSYIKKLCSIAVL